MLWFLIYEDNVRDTSLSEPQARALHIEDPQCTSVLWIKQLVNTFYRSKRLSKEKKKGPQISSRKIDHLYPSPEAALQMLMVSPLQGWHKVALLRLYLASFLCWSHFLSSLLFFSWEHFLISHFHTNPCLKVNFGESTLLTISLTTISGVLGISECSGISTLSSTC